MIFAKPSPDFLTTKRREANERLQKRRQELAEARDFFIGWPESEVAIEWVRACEDELERAVAAAEEWR